jgi:putative SOS response-associated peptidase YedK
MNDGANGTVQNSVMCNRYRATEVVRIRDAFGFTYIESGPPRPYRTSGIGPWQEGPFIVPAGLRVGQWGLIPWFSMTKRPTGRGGRPISTNNCRIETIATAPTFKQPWALAKRCLIPADDYDEPYWGTGKNIWWRFGRADGQPWALAGIWSDWTDPDTGEVVPSYTMATTNCDAHPLLSLMHKPDPTLQPDQQDKRSIVAIERKDWEQWLTGSAEEALQLVRPPAHELFRHGAADPSLTVPLPILGSQS